MPNSLTTTIPNPTQIVRTPAWDGFKGGFGEVRAQLGWILVRSG